MRTHVLCQQSQGSSLIPRAATVLTCTCSTQIRLAHIVHHTRVDVVGLPSSVASKVMMVSIPVLGSEEPTTAVSVLLPAHNFLWALPFEHTPSSKDVVGKPVDDRVRTRDSILERAQMQIKRESPLPLSAVNSLFGPVTQ